MIDELLKLINVDQLIQAVITQYRGATEQQIETMLDRLPITLNRAPLMADVRELDKQVADRLTDLLSSSYRPLVIKLYSETFTTQELTDVVAFYKTPSGHALLAKQPELLTKSIAAGQQLVRDSDIQKFINDWVDRMKKKYSVQ